MKTKARDEMSVRKRQKVEEQDEEDLELLKRKGGIKDVYQSDEEVSLDSDDEDQDQPTQDDDDMFQEKSKFLESRDFEGQEWNLNQDEELESFNMDKELQEGDFTSSGVYIRKKDEFAVHDSWLKGITKKDIENARIAHEKQQQQQLVLGDWSVYEAYQEIKEILEPKETILNAIKRLGAHTKTVPKWKKKKTISEQSEEEKRKYKGQMDILTSHCSRLINSDPSVYEKTFEEICYLLEHYDGE